MKTPLFVHISTLLVITLLLIPLGSVLAADPAECALDRGDQLRDRDHDQIRDRDRLHDGTQCLVLLGGDQDRLRTRDRLRDQDCQLIFQNAGEVRNRNNHRNNIRHQNQFMLNGETPPNPLGFILLPNWLF